jgi:cytochrome c553
MSSPWRGLFVAALVLAGVAAVGGALVALSGIVPIKASSGHWAVTAWFLDFAKVRSVSTHAFGVELPPIEDPVLVMQGAGHYESGCMPCHGAPGSAMPTVAAAMTPPPPYLPALITRWDAEDLFYIVKHGIKFTGMPAWPAAERDDEVHAVVAFLLRLPELDAAAYARLVFGADEAPDGSMRTLASSAPAPTDGETLAASCARCHGGDGLGRELPAFPKLAGQKRAYLANALEAYANGKRPSGVMQPIAAALSPQARARLAQHYSALPVGAASAPVKNADAVERGARLADQGDPARGVPSCRDCHGPSPRRRNAAYPLLAGQHEAYLLAQLTLFSREQRGGSPFAHLMQHVATRLAPAQIRDAAAYYASLPAQPAAH